MLTPQETGSQVVNNDSQADQAEPENVLAGEGANPFETVSQEAIAPDMSFGGPAPDYNLVHGSPFGSVSFEPNRPFSESNEDALMFQFQHFVGTTGAIGGSPELPQVENIESFRPTRELNKEAVKALKSSINALDKETALKHFKSLSIEADSISTTANACLVNIAFSKGLILKHLQAFVIEEKQNWSDYINHELEPSRRTCDKYMAIAANEYILNHTYLGIDHAYEVIQIIKPIKSLIQSEDGDPLAGLLQLNNIRLDDSSLTVREVKSMVMSAVIKQKLEREGISIAWELIKDFRAVADDIKAEDIAVMKEKIRTGQDPESYLKHVITLNGNRPELEGKSDSPKKKIKYINAETVKLADAVQYFVENKVSPENLDRLHIEALMNNLSVLLELLKK